MQSTHTLLKLAQLNGLAMSPECLTCGYQRKSSMENFKWESAPNVTRRNAIRIPWNSVLRISTHHQSTGNRLHNVVQSGAALSEREQRTMKLDPRDHHQSQHLQNWLAVFATDSLEPNHSQKINLTLPLTSSERVKTLLPFSDYVW